MFNITFEVNHASNCWLNKDFEYAIMLRAWTQSFKEINECLISSLRDICDVHAHGVGVCIWRPLWVIHKLEFMHKYVLVGCNSQQHTFCYLTFESRWRLQYWQWQHYRSTASKLTKCLFWCTYTPHLHQYLWCFDCNILDLERSLYFTSMSWLPP